MVVQLALVTIIGERVQKLKLFSPQRNEKLII
jgi:hypothetical protein